MAESIWVTNAERIHSGLKTSGQLEIKDSVGAITLYENVLRDEMENRDVRSPNGAAQTTISIVFKIPRRSTYTKPVKGDRASFNGETPVIVGNIRTDAGRWRVFSAV